jgi:hypothetical protein
MGDETLRVVTGSASSRGSSFQGEDGAKISQNELQQGSDKIRNGEEWDQAEYGQGGQADGESNEDTEDSEEEQGSMPSSVFAFCFADMAQGGHPKCCCIECWFKI